jgi:transmembrane sensor
MKSEMNLDLAVRYLTGSANDSDKLTFEKWLALSEQNQLQFEKLKNYWKISGSAYDNYQPDLKIAWDNIKNQTIDKHIYSIKAFYRIAIAVTILLFLGVGAKMFMKSQYIYETQLITYLSDSSVKEIQLSDGSRVWLNAQSSLLAPKKFKFHKRMVYLTGEAYFEVTKNPDKPFIIKAQNTYTEVLGTSFNIQALKNEKQVTVNVETGKVAFYPIENSKGRVYLTHGMKGVWTNNSSEMHVYNVKTKNYSSWKTGILLFNDTPLDEVCGEIGSYYKVNFNIDSINAHNYLFTGKFNNIELEQLLNIISATLDIKFVKGKDEIEVIF